MLNRPIVSEGLTGAGGLSSKTVYPLDAGRWQEASVSTHMDLSMGCLSVLMTQWLAGSSQSRESKMGQGRNHMSYRHSSEVTHHHLREIRLFHRSPPSSIEGDYVRT